MAQARREQLRFTMLPQMAGKFDRERFLRTGYAGERRTYAPPDTPAMRAAYEQAARERAELEARLRNG